MEKYGNYPGTNHHSPAGIIEAMYRNVLLASGRANPASAKPCGPAGDVPGRREVEHREVSWMPDLRSGSGTSV